jgi:DNA-binding FrmR family transcriptional regulator
VAHLIRDKQKLIARVRRIGGQLDAVERALVQEADCDETLRLLASARGAMNGLMFEVLEGFIRDHIVTKPLDPTSEEARAVEQLVDVVRAYLK